MCERLNVAMYGTRDAALAWEKHYSTFLESLGFRKSIGCQNAFYHEARAIRIIVHGDDFITGGPETEIQKFKEEMSKKYEAKHQIMGPGRDHSKKINVLNREIEWHQRKITMEADSKHVKAVIKELGLEHAKVMGTPGVKDRHEKVQQEKEKHMQERYEVERDNDTSAIAKERRKLKNTVDEAHVDDSIGTECPNLEVEVDGRATEELNHKIKPEEYRKCNEKESRMYRSIVMKLNYLAMDRPEVQWSVRRCAKNMSSPNTEDLERLKRIGRYLKGKPRVRNVMLFRLNREDITVKTDSDWAGKEDGRRSVSGGTIYVCGQWVQSWSKDQTKVARSSGEAELYACNLGASKGLGLQTVMKELGWNYELRIQVDANATIGTLHRRGLEKLRHVEVEELWLQQEISKKKLSVTKIKGTENTADIGTKALKKEAVEYLMQKMHFDTLPSV